MSVLQLMHVDINIINALRYPALLGDLAVCKGSTLCIKMNKCDVHLYSGLDEVQPESQGFPHEDVWVVGGLECFL